MGALQINQFFMCFIYAWIDWLNEKEEYRARLVVCIGIFAWAEKGNRPFGCLQTTALLHKPGIKAPPG
jgi:hypothetical protein